MGKISEHEKELRDQAAERRGGLRAGYLNVRFSDRARYILDELQDLLGLSQGSVIEMLLREEARRREIAIPGSGQDLIQQAEHAALADKIRATSGPAYREPEDTKPGHKAKR